MKKLALIVVLACLLLTSSFASEAKPEKDIIEFTPRPAKGVDVFQTPDPIVEQIRQARKNGDIKTYDDLLEIWKSQLPAKEEDEQGTIAIRDESINSPLLRWGNDVVIYNGDVYYDTWVDNEDEPITVDYHDNDSLWAAVACPDSVVRIFISEDNGLNWSYWNGLIWGGEQLKEPEIICGPDGRFIHVFMHTSANNGNAHLHNFDVIADSNQSCAIGSSADQVLNYTVTSDRCDYESSYWLYLAMHCYAGGADADSVSFTRSFNRGATWTTPAALLLNGCGVPNLSYGSDDWLYMAYWTDQLGEYYINTKRSSNSGGSWFGSLIMFHDTTTKQGPQIAAAHDGSGDVWLLFSRRNDANPNYDYGVQWRWSQNFGENWSGLGWVNSWVDSNEVFPSIDIFDGYNSSFGYYPYVTFIRAHHDWTNPIVYCYNWQTDSIWSQATSFNDSVPEFVRPIQTWCDNGWPAMAYVGEGGVNVYYDGWAVGAVEEEKEPPVSSQLTIKTNPNPFSKTTRIQYSLPSKGIVSVHAYNILGQRVATLFDGVQESGNHYLQWNGVGNNGSKLPKGVYFLRIKTQNAETRAKLTIIN